MRKSVIETRGILFDLDGVIIDSEELYFRAYSAVLAEFGVSVTREIYGREWIAKGTGPEYAATVLGVPLAPEEIRDRKNPIYHKLLCDEVALMPGVVPALERLGARFPIVLATNSQRPDVEFVMQRFGLGRYFRDLITRERYARSKPAPDAFVAAAEALGLPPQRCLVVEDAYKGVVAGHAAGCTVVAVPHDMTRGNDFSLCARVLGSLDEVTVELVDDLIPV